jgi:enoyl-CoA hydratase/carnithine racemase
LRREDGILEIRLHHEGGEFVWGTGPHQELGGLFRNVGDDVGNRIVILTGTGSVFTGLEATPATRSVFASLTPREWYVVTREARQLLMNELDIDVPMIAAINGPAYRHMELALLCDILISSEDGVFEDAAHLPQGNLVPGDGMNLLLAELMGVNRARYLQLTGQRLTAAEAVAAGLVNEVVPKDEVLPRAWALARQLAQKPDLLLRHSRMLMTQRLKHLLIDHLTEHMLHEGIAQLDQDDPARR